MVVAGRERALRDDAEPLTALEQKRSDVATAVEMYLKLVGGDTRRALALAVADAIDASRLVSRGFARWGDPSGSRERAGTAGTRDTGRLSLGSSPPSV